jgi:Flp pilus assembly protein TadD
MSLRNARTAAGACALLLLAACTTPAAQEKEQEQAAAEARKAAADTGVALKLASAARAAGDSASAVNLYKSALEVAPADNSIRVELGEAQLDTGAVDDAVLTFGAVDAKSADYLEAVLGLERAQLMLRDPAKALSYADAAVALAPRDKRAQVGRGVALDMLGRHHDAQPCYRAAIALDPQDVAARSDLALSLAFTDDFDEAISILTPLARDPSATPRLRQNLALVYGLKGDTAAARALGRTDLTPAEADANLKFFDLVRANTGEAVKPDSKPKP